jgi:hypothetical protein
MNGNKSGMLEAIAKINTVEGFDPAGLAIEYTDMNTGEKRLHLPVMAQLGWFRLRYPEGRISLSAAAENGYFVATAKVYKDYKDPEGCFLAEASASRGPHPTKPSISPREWAQTAAVGIALRNAGFGIQFHMGGDNYDQLATVDELQQAQHAQAEPEPAEYEISSPEEADSYETALRAPCPIKKYHSKTLGDLVSIDPKALAWLANSYSADPAISDAAKMICEKSLESLESGNNQN